MQQYFENRTLKKYEDIKSENTKQDSIVLANQRIDAEWQSKNYKINNSTFAKMGFLKSRFSNDLVVSSRFKIQPNDFLPLPLSTLRLKK